ncbi:5-oxoprolinase subunit PxpA [Psychroflexus aestuariivivens]|uniref:5-oxoprolinase subunit PxpA n=1 Tax=Psychroflexus aestuariivivens TaxID=1795040 RepID=UPI000FD9590C|nr:5-oxoprolinase subunit PxpA [Psychroflexus aestuariivivens]
MNSVDLNCDLAEGGNFDAQIFPLVSSCNIACGGHFGNYDTVLKAVRLAKTNSTKIGAHPSYPDFENFGRKSLKISFSELKNHLHQQINLVEKACNEVGAELHHVKPHGALYNDLKSNSDISKIVFEVVKERNKKLVVFVPPNSEISIFKDKNIQFWKEGFADRNYNPDLSLVSRTQNFAVITDKEIIAKRVQKMIQLNEIKTINNKRISQKFDTICLHSDTPNSIEILKYLIKFLNDNHIKIR